MFANTPYAIRSKRWIKIFQLIYWNHLHRKIILFNAFIWIQLCNTCFCERRWWLSQYDHRSGVIMQNTRIHHDTIECDIPIIKLNEKKNDFFSRHISTVKSLKTYFEIRNYFFFNENDVNNTKLWHMKFDPSHFTRPILRLTLLKIKVQFNQLTSINSL